MHIKHKKPTEMAKLGAEFIGTYMLVFTVCLNITTKAVDSGLARALGIFAPTSIACVLMVLIYSLGAISGAHLNPAVTVACYLQEAIERMEAIKYIITQCAAGVLAGLSTVLLDGYAATSNAMVGPITTDFAVGAPVVEFLYTFMLCFTVLNVCVAKKTQGNMFYGVAIGFVVMAGGYGGGYVSGGFFNPAIVLGVNFMGLSWWGALYVPIYIGCHLGGAIMAPVALHFVRPEMKLQEVNAVTKFFYKFQAKFDPEDTAEFLGATFLALSLSLNAIANTYDLSLSTEEHPHTGNPGGSLSVGAALMCMIFSLGDVSGGLFNPAVTLAYLGRFHGTGCGVGKDKLQDMQTSPKEGIKYFLAQTLGAVAGMGLTILIWMASGIFPIAAIGPQPIGTNATDPTDTYTLSQAFFAETFGTFLYCFVVICVATTFTPLKDFKAFAIGCTFIAGGYAFGPLSGGVLNPAVTIAACLVRLQAVTQPLVPAMYVGGELLGSILAALVFRFLTHAHEMEMEGQPEGYERLSDPERPPSNGTPLLTTGTS